MDYKTSLSRNFAEKGIREIRNQIEKQYKESFFAFFF